MTSNPLRLRGLRVLLAACACAAGIAGVAEVRVLSSNAMREVLLEAADPQTARALILSNQPMPCSS